MISPTLTVRALSDPALIPFFNGGEGPSLEETFLALLRAAAQAGELQEGVDLALEAELLLALQDGMSSRLLLHMRSTEHVRRLIDYHLDRIFAGSSP